MPRPRNDQDLLSEASVAFIRERMEALGIRTQKQIVDRTGLSDTYMSEVFRRRRAPSMLALIRIAKVLATTPGRILDPEAHRDLLVWDWKTYPAADTEPEVWCMMKAPWAGPKCFGLGNPPPVTADTNVLIVDPSAAWGIGSTLVCEFPPSVGLGFYIPDRDPMPESIKIIGRIVGTAAIISYDKGVGFLVANEFSEGPGVAKLERQMAERLRKRMQTESIAALQRSLDQVNQALAEQDLTPELVDMLTHIRKDFEATLKSGDFDLYHETLLALAEAGALGPDEEDSPE